MTITVKHPINGAYTRWAGGTSGGGGVPVAANTRVAWIGDDTTDQAGAGPAAILEQLQAAGWSPSSKVDGAAGRKIRDGGSTSLAIGNARTGGWDASTWVLALGGNSSTDSPSKWAADVNGNLDDIAAAGGAYTVFLLGCTTPTQSAAASTSYYSTLRSVAASNTRPNLAVRTLDVNNTLHTGEPETGWWATGFTMTTTGYAWRNQLTVAGIGGPSLIPAPANPVPYETLTGGTFAQRINSAPGANITLSSGTYTCTDFADAAGFAGVWAQNTAGIYGPADRSALIQMNPGTSTKASSLPAHGSNQPNLFNLFRVDGSPRIYGLTLNGTDQGMPYSGLFLYQTTDAIVSHCDSVAIPGNDSVPPGETSGVQVYASTRTRVFWCNLRGPNGAVGLAPNGGSDVTVADSVFDGVTGAASHEVANYNVRNITYTRCTFKNTTWRGANNERVSGRAVYQNCTWSNVQPTAHMEVENDKGSAFIHIIDPVFTGSTFNVRCGSKYLGATNIQDLSAIKLYVNGVERPDLLNVYVV